MQPERRRRLVGIAMALAKAAVALAVFAWIAHIVDFDAAFAVVAALPASAAVGTLLALLLQAVLSAWRWALISPLAGPRLSMSTAFPLFMVSLFYNQALPTTVAGDAVRVVGAARQGLGAPAAVIGVLLDRILTLCGLLLLVCISQAILSVGGAASAVGPSVFALTLAAFLTMALIALRPALWSRLLPGRLGEAVGRFAGATARLVRDRHFPHLLVLTLVIHGLSIVAFYSLAWGMALPIGWWQLWLALPPVLLAAILPVSIGGWGLREGSMVVVLAGFGIGSTEAATLSVLFGLLQLALGLAAGLFVFLPARPPGASGPA